MHLQKSVVSCGVVSPRLPRARTRCTRSIRTALRSYLGKRMPVGYGSSTCAISTSAGVSRPNMLTLSLTLKLSVSMPSTRPIKPSSGPAVICTVSPTLKSTVSGAAFSTPIFSTFSLQRLLRKQTFQPYKRLPENPWKNRNRMVVGEVENGELRVKNKE